MTDDFFAAFDAKLGEAKASAAQRATAREEAEAFAERVIAPAIIFANSVAERLASRGISAEVIPSTTSVTFTMRFKNQDKHDLFVGLEHERPGIQATSYHVDENGRPYSATTGTLYRASNWTDATYSELLKKHVDDYASYASRHGGVA